MKMLFIGAHYHRLHDVLREAGHDVRIIDYWRRFGSGGDQSSSPMDEEQVNESVYNIAVEFNSDVVIQWKGWYHDGKIIRNDTIKRIRQALAGRCVCVYWSVDDPDFLLFWRSRMSEFGTWDVALTCCRASVKEYIRKGVPEAHYFLPGHDVTWNEAVKEGNKAPGHCQPLERGAVDLVIAGSAYRRVMAADVGRAEVAMAALSMGLTVELYGPDIWRSISKSDMMVTGHDSLSDCYKGYLAHDDVAYALARAKICFNNHLRTFFGYDPDRYDGYCNDKRFQINGLGLAVELTDFQPGSSPDVYTVGKECLQYGPEIDADANLDSIKRMLDSYLSNPKVLTEMGEAAKARTFAEHLWEHRAEQMVRIFEPLVKNRQS